MARVTIYKVYDYILGRLFQGSNIKMVKNNARKSAVSKGIPADYVDKYIRSVESIGRANVTPLPHELEKAINFVPGKNPQFNLIGSDYIRNFYLSIENSSNNKLPEKKQAKHVVLSTSKLYNDLLRLFDKYKKMDNSKPNYFSTNTLFLDEVLGLFGNKVDNSGVFIHDSNERLIDLPKRLVKDVKDLGEASYVLVKLEHKDVKEYLTFSSHPVRYAYVNFNITNSEGKSLCLILNSSKSACNYKVDIIYISKPLSLNKISEMV